jgi:hypothetical protein
MEIKSRRSRGVSSSQLNSADIENCDRLNTPELSLALATLQLESTQGKQKNQGEKIFMPSDVRIS